MFSLWYAFLAYRELKLYLEDKGEADESESAAATTDDVPEITDEETDKAKGEGAAEGEEGGEDGEGKEGEAEGAEGEGGDGAEGEEGADEGKEGAEDESKDKDGVKEGDEKDKGEKTAHRTKEFDNADVEFKGPHKSGVKSTTGTGKPGSKYKGDIESDSELMGKDKLRLKSKGQDRTDLKSKGQDRTDLKSKGQDRTDLKSEGQDRTDLKYKGQEKGDRKSKERDNADVKITSNVGVGDKTTARDKPDPGTKDHVKCLCPVNLPSLRTGQRGLELQGHSKGKFEGRDNSHLYSKGKVKEKTLITVYDDEEEKRRLAELEAAEREVSERLNRELDRAERLKIQVEREHQAHPSTGVISKDTFKKLRKDLKDLKQEVSDLEATNTTAVHKMRDRLTEAEFAVTESIAQEGEEESEEVGEKRRKKAKLVNA